MTEKNENTKQEDQDKKQGNQNEEQEKPFYKERNFTVASIGLAIVLAIGIAFILPANPTGECAGAACNTNKTLGNTSNTQIENGSVAVLDYKVKTLNGTEVDTQKGMELAIGEGKIKPEIEEAVKNMEINETKEIKNYTTVPEKRTQQIPRSQLEKDLNTTVKEGEEYTIQGTTLTVNKVTNKTILATVMNPSPYAGKTLDLVITLKDIKEPYEDIEKTETPKAEIFVMSYCPYGTQMQKAVIPVQKLLGDKADIDIKFVDYAMHEKKEIEENTRQHCIQKDNPEKYWNYLECFLNTSNSTQCMSNTNLNPSKIENCITQTYKEYNIIEEYNNKSTWKGNFPPYPLQSNLNEKYEVSGSPTFVLNGEKIDNMERNAEAIKKAICQTFKEKPPECQETLSTKTPIRGFGLEGESNTDEGTC